MTENIDIRQRIGSELRALRLAKGLTTRELAGQIGITHSHIVRIENGKYAISIDTLNKICQALGVAIQLTDNSKKNDNMTDREKAISNLLEWAQLNADLNHVKSRFGGDILVLDYTVGDMRIHGITLTEDRNGEYIDIFALTAEKEIANHRCAVQQKPLCGMFDTATTTANTLYNFHINAKNAFMRLQERIASSKNTGTTKP